MKHLLVITVLLSTSAFARPLKTHEVQIIRYRMPAGYIEHDPQLDFTRCQFSDTKPWNLDRPIYDGINHRGVAECATMLKEKWGLPLVGRYRANYALFGLHEGRVTRVMPGQYCHKVEYQIAVRQSTFNDPKFSGLGFDVYDRQMAPWKESTDKNLGLFYSKNDDSLTAAKTGEARMRFSNEPVYLFNFVSAGPCDISNFGYVGHFQIRPYVLFEDGTKHVEDLRQPMPGKVVGSVSDFHLLETNEPFYAYEGMALKPMNE